MTSKARRYAALGIFVAMASLAGANPAQAREIGTAGRVWQWMQEAWQLNALIPWNRPAAPAANARITEKEGPGLDPNGKPAPPSSSSICDFCSDLGWGIDPNG